MDDFQWIKDIKRVPFSETQTVPLPGDEVICLPGFNGDGGFNREEYVTASEDPMYGGGGYEEGLVITVREIESTTYRDDAVVRGGNTKGGYGVFLRALAPNQL